MDSQKIKPFSISIPQEDIDDLMYRLEKTRWIDEDFKESWNRGIPVGHLKELAKYWRNRFDWRKQEAKLNSHPQFTANIDNQQIHFYNVRSQENDALPLLIIHGYPSSIVETANIIERLTNPVAFGGNSSEASHVIIPSLPGYGFSNPLQSEGWDTHRTALAFKELNAEAAGIALLGSPLPLAENVSLSESARKRIEKLHTLQKEGRGYLQLQSTRPLTISYALTDSPVGQLAWIAEKFKEWTDTASTLPDGIDRDLLLTNVCIYWFTKTSFSAANLIYENYHSSKGWAPQGSVPTGFAVFDVDGIVRGVFDPEGRIKHWSEFDRGGHFPALEVPDLLVADIRKFFAEL